MDRHRIQRSAIRSDVGCQYFRRIRKALIVGQQKRSRTLKDLDAAALQLSTVCRRLIDSTYDDATIRATIYADTSQEKIAAAITQIERLVRPPHRSANGIWGAGAERPETNPHNDCSPRAQVGVRQEKIDTAARRPKQEG